MKRFFFAAQKKLSIKKKQIKSPFSFGEGI
jgi:hypothetical protein